MDLTKRDRTIKYVVYCLLIAVSSLLQNASGSLLELGNARCFLVIPVVVVLGIDEDERVAGLLGLFGGLLWDAVAGQHLGFNAIFLMLFCYISSALVSYLLVSRYWIRFGFCVVAELIYVLLYWLLFVMTKGDNTAGATFGYFYIPCFFYTAFVSLLVAWVLSPLVMRLNKEQRIY